jgi:hypothetical protein
MRVAPGSGFFVDHPSFRAELRGAERPAAEIAFVYRGPSPQAARLASGEVRRQVGLKLRARDTCNLVYVMWHIAPSQKIEVSVKSNPDQRTHEECGDRGYTFVTPSWASSEVSPIKAGERHTLRASLRGDVLEVAADGRASWKGNLPPQAFAFDGPVGVRSDNAAFDFELWAGPGPAEAVTAP